MSELTRAELAARWRTSEETISDCVHRRGLPAYRVGRDWLFIEADCINWLRTQPIKGDACGSTSEEKKASGGSIGALRASSLLDAVLAPQTGRRRRSTPPKLTPITGGKQGLVKSPSAPGMRP
ncbi:MAG: helix-turn-helix domain-containing protein [Burkholderiaceae bacterium]